VTVATLQALSKSYGARLAIDGVSLDVGENEVVGLLGPNGSGKTTILRILTGYLRPSAGTARIAGHDIVTDGPAARARVGYVPEDVPLYPHMRVDEFLSFMGRLRGLEGTRLRRAVALAREKLSLEGVGATIIGRLSRGYRQRVAIAQAILHEPALLVLDEPTNGLDPRQVIELRQVIRDLAARCSVVLASHVLSEIELLADRAAILLRGRLLTVRRLERARVLRITTPAALAAHVLEILASAGRATDIEDAGTTDGIATWRIRSPDEGAVERLVARLSAAGIGVVEIAQERSDLEETFLNLTSGRTGA
jgi:ABC-2 type transport system ATP-binding protein